MGGGRAGATLLELLPALTFECKDDNWTGVYCWRNGQESLLWQVSQIYLLPTFQHQQLLMAHGHLREDKPVLLIIRLLFGFAHTLRELQQPPQYLSNSANLQKVRRQCCFSQSCFLRKRCFFLYLTFWTHRGLIVIFRRFYRVGIWSFLVTPRPLSPAI